MRLGKIRFSTKIGEATDAGRPEKLVSLAKKGNLGQLPLKCPEVRERRPKLEGLPRDGDLNNGIRVEGRRGPRVREFL